MNDEMFVVKGLRCSNALLSDQSAASLIEFLDTVAAYGLNTVSVFFQGSRFGDIKGYREDASLDPVYAARMGRIIEAADKRGQLVIVGCLYWGNSKGKWADWTQEDANRAVFNTVNWLRENHYRNVLVDVDNEGMANKEAGFDIRQLILAGKKADPGCVIGYNSRSAPPLEADLSLHFGPKVPGKPYIESEGSAGAVPDGYQRPGYWGDYSKRAGLYNYINIGLYTPEMKKNQIATTDMHIGSGSGYMLASTWLQCVPPEGPNHTPGGYGDPEDPGIRWWLEHILDTYGPYVAKSIDNKPE